MFEFVEVVRAGLAVKNEEEFAAVSLFVFIAYPVFNQPGLVKIAGAQVKHLRLNGRHVKPPFFKLFFEIL